MVKILIVVILVVLLIAFILLFRNKIPGGKEKFGFMRIITYVLLFALLSSVVLMPENKVFIYVLLAASIAAFGLNQFVRMKQIGGNPFLWFLPIILAILVAILFFYIKHSAA